MGFIQELQDRQDRQVTKSSPDEFLPDEFPPDDQPARRHRKLRPLKTAEIERPPPTIPPTSCQACQSRLFWADAYGGIHCGCCVDPPLAAVVVAWWAIVPDSAGQDHWCRPGADPPESGDLDGWRWIDLNDGRQAVALTWFGHDGRPSEPVEGESLNEWFNRQRTPPSPRIDTGKRFGFGKRKASPSQSIIWPPTVPDEIVADPLPTCGACGRGVIPCQPGRTFGLCYHCWLSSKLA